MSRDPVLDGLKCAGQLTGLSAANVYLVSEDGRRWFVRKAVKRSEGNERLRRQAAKQRVFAEQLDAIHVPRILNDGETGGRYFFDMEYVQGQDGISFLRRASYPEINDFTDRLSTYLEAIARADPTPSGSPGLFTSMYRKLCEVQAKTNAIPPRALANLFLAMERLLSFEDFSETLCHGDLTLENMIVREDGTIVVLDLLAAPFEHYWQDIAKLHQDLAGGWFMRTGGRISQCVLDHVGRRLMRASLALNHDYEAVHPLLMAVVFVRILPYVRNDEERAFVLERIEYFSARSVI